MFRIWMLLAILLFSNRRLVAQETSQVDTLVVCANKLLPALTPWLEHRQRQGRQLALIDGQGTAKQIQASIRRLAGRSRLTHVVFVGDTTPERAGGETCVPTLEMDATVTRDWGADPTFASDNGFGDIDGDGVPELAVGRITADTPDELSRIVAKILKYELALDAGLWRRKVNFVAGVGGLGMVVDAMVETTAKKFITDGIPASFATSMTQASWRSPYSPDPRRFRSQVIERMNEGCLAWVYLGHGQVHGLDHYHLPQGRLSIFEARDAANINVRQGAPIAVFLACYAGAFDAEPDCLGEQLLATADGPVAVIAGSSVTMPYGMTVLGNAMLQELFHTRRETLGEVVLHAKQTLAKIPDPGTETTLDRLATVLSPKPARLPDERREHVALFQLLGDPLLRLRQPETVELTVADRAEPGTNIVVQGTSPVDGECLVELVCRRDRLTFSYARPTQFEPTEESFRSMQENYLRANDPCWSSKSVAVSQGVFQTTMEVPATAAGHAHVRVFVQGDNRYAMGATEIYLQRPIPSRNEPGDGRIDDRATK